MKHILLLLATMLYSESATAQINVIAIDMSREGGIPGGNFIVEDSLGRKTGYDPILKTSYSEIPNTQHGDFDLGNEVSGRPLLVVNEFIMEPAVEGIYTVKVIGTRADSFKLNIRLLHVGSSPTIFDFFGTTSPSSVTEYEIFYDPHITAILTARLIIDIDIKPGSDPNSINPRSKGVIPVAILTNQNFDATTVDVSTVVFGPGGAPLAHNGHIEDVDGDGDNDLMLHFKTQKTGIQCGDTEATLSGETIDGQAIGGSDSVKTVGCK